MFMYIIILQLLYIWVTHLDILARMLIMGLWFMEPVTITVPGIVHIIIPGIQLMAMVFITVHMLAGAFRMG